ncbi:MAG: pseudouridine synthase, partial [Planctomycetaceae bacterium]
MSDSQESTPGVRLQRLLAMAGIGSRRSCEEYITTGRVTVNGQTITELGARVDPDEQDVRLDGERLHIHRRSYYLVNKPVGVLCTNRDPEGRPRVIDLFPKASERLFTVGRLDENSEGLLLVTNDGELAHRLAHPRFKVEKIYRVQVAGVPSREIVDQLQEGMYFAEGRFAAKSATLVKTKGHSSLLEIVLTEGQNREIRRLLARVGHKVQRLKRVGMGSLRLGELPPGLYRPLSPPEIQALRALVSEGTRRGRGRDRTRDRTRRGPSGDRRRPDRRAERGGSRKSVDRSPRVPRSERGSRGRPEQRREQPGRSPAADSFRPARERRPGRRPISEELPRRFPARGGERDPGLPGDESPVIRRRPAADADPTRSPRRERGPAGRERGPARPDRRPPRPERVDDYVPRELARNPDDDEDDEGPRPPQPRRGGPPRDRPGRPSGRPGRRPRDTDDSAGGGFVPTGEEGLRRSGGPRTGGPRTGGPRTGGPRS